MSGYFLLKALSICSNSEVLVSGKVKLQNRVFWVCDEHNVLWLVFDLGSCYHSPSHILNKPTLG